MIARERGVNTAVTHGGSPPHQSHGTGSWKVCDVVGQTSRCGLVWAFFAVCSALVVGPIRNTSLKVINRNNPPGQEASGIKSAKSSFSLGGGGFAAKDGKVEGGVCHFVIFVSKVTHVDLVLCAPFVSPVPTFGYTKMFLVEIFCLRQSLTS